MPKKTAAKKATVGKDLIEGMKLVLAHQRGKIELEQVWPKPIDIKAIRKGVKMSQAEFSRAYGISKRALQEWEQGGRQPDSTADRTCLSSRSSQRLCDEHSPHVDIRQALNNGVGKAEDPGAP